MNNRATDDSSAQGTDIAWGKLQQKLEKEPANPVWANWGKQQLDIKGNRDEADSAANRVEHEMIPIPQIGPQSPGTNITQNPIRKSRRTELSRRRKWAGAAAGVAIFAAVLATPVGNTAMAAILNQFRMHDVAVVDESDLRDIFYQVSEEGNFRKTMNSFGAFSLTNGSISGELPAGQMHEVLGYEPLKEEDIGAIKTVEVNPSRDFTLTLNVDEVNQALKRVGSTDLLPESVDGKPITLHLPEIVNYDLSTDQEHWASLAQMNTPVLSVDPSIDMKEALDAVLNFPLLPDYLRNSLQKSRILSGDIPMPLIKGNNAEEITVAGIPVILNVLQYSKGASYIASWVREGQMFELSGGDLYPDKDKFIEKVGELITQ